MGQAIDYALGQWPALSTYLSDGRVEIDNNLVENAIRPLSAVWRRQPSAKRTGSSSATQEPATAEPSSTASWKAAAAADSTPYRYLSEVLTALPTLTNWQVKDWTPEAWAKSQRPARKAA